jgi:hypothetical protein
LADARRRRDEARQKIEAGTDPGAQRRLTEGATERTLEAITQHYLAGLERKVLLKKRSPHTLRKARWALRDYIFPYIGSKPIDSISSQQLSVVQMKVRTNPSCDARKQPEPHSSMKTLASFRTRNTRRTKIVPMVAAMKKNYDFSKSVKNPIFRS